MGGQRAETRMNGINIEKKCNKCKIFKLLIDFRRAADGSYGTRNICLNCDKLYYEENIERIRKSARRCELRDDFNLTVEEYERLIKNGCEVCGSFDRLHVDHDHITNTVRGILCQNCNIALGLLKDDVSRILKLAHYLEEKSLQVAKK